MGTSPPTIPMKRPAKVGLSTPAKLFLAALFFVSICSFGLDTQSRLHVVQFRDTAVPPGELPHVMAQHWFTVDEWELRENAYLKVVPLVHSIADGLKTHYSRPGPPLRRLPFVVRGAREWRAVNATLISQVLAASKQVLTSVTYPKPREQKDVDVAAHDALKHWSEGDYVSVVASPMRELLPLLPHELRKDDLNKFEDGAGPSPLVSSAPTATPLHIDPVEDGGAWAFLAAGKKFWVLLPPDWAEHLPTTGGLDFKWPGSLSALSQIAGRLGPDKVGPIFVAVAGPGDFLCWPPGWLHGVSTPEPSLGIAGYLRLATDDAAIEAVPPVARFADPKYPHIAWPVDDE